MQTRALDQTTEAGTGSLQGQIEKARPWVVRSRNHDSSLLDLQDNKTVTYQVRPVASVQRSLVYLLCIGR